MALRFKGKRSRVVSGLPDSPAFVAQRVLLTDAKIGKVFRDQWLALKRKRLGKPGARPFARSESQLSVAALVTNVKNRKSISPSKSEKLYSISAI
jgi:hypothetical protein